MNKQWWIEQIVEIRTKMGRGKSWFQEIREIIFIGTFLGVYGFPIWSFIPLGIGIFIAFYFIGSFDIEKIRLQQEENKYQTSLNPVMMEIKENVKKEESNVKLAQQTH